MARPFLTAAWRDLILVSYAVEPTLLEPHTPPGLDLDLFEGSAAVCSLVAFRFIDTRVMGVRWPGLTHFCEINLRLYVREPCGRRGVVFVRELVASRLICAVATRLYNEPYKRAKVSGIVQTSEDSVEVEYNFEYGGGRGVVRVGGDAAPFVPPEDSAEHWFKEHQWGYGVTRRGRTLRYEVRHPVWACRRVRTSEVSVDFEKIYGSKWSCLAAVEPINITFAVGSPVEVHKGIELGD